MEEQNVQYLRKVFLFLFAAQVFVSLLLFILRTIKINVFGATNDFVILLFFTLQIQGLALYLAIKAIWKSSDSDRQRKWSDTIWILLLGWLGIAMWIRSMRKQ